MVLRAGYSWRGENLNVGGMTGLAAGVGFRLGRLGLDYAYQPFGDLATSHRIALVYGLNVSSDAMLAKDWRDRPIAVSTVGLEEDAIPDYEDALKLYRAKDYREAMRLAERAVEMDRMYWQAWELVGSCRYNLGDTPGALDAYRAALEVNPQNPQLKAVVADLEAGKARPLEPSSTPAPAKPAVPAPQGVNVDAEYQVCVQLYNAKDIDGAWRRAAAALNANPRHWQSWQMIGNCQYAKGDKQGALSSYRYALQLNPDNPSLKTFVDQLAK
jgi:tetratricopeptide (TPR) repeat protein